MKEVVELLIEKHKRIATMESCTGGFIASSITDIDGSSEILSFSAVTYSNEYKIKLGVNQETIDVYSVYSKEVAEEMAKNITDIALSDYGIGITGKINRSDKNNLYGENNKIYYSIYDKTNNKFSDFELTTIDDTRYNNKIFIKDNIAINLLKMLKKEEENN